MKSKPSSREGLPGSLLLPLLAPKPCYTYLDHLNQGRVAAVYFSRLQSNFNPGPAYPRALHRVRK